MTLSKREQALVIAALTRCATELTQGAAAADRLGVDAALIRAHETEFSLLAHRLMREFAL